MLRLRQTPRRKHTSLLIVRQRTARPAFENRNGFTLVELLVAIGIIAVLTAITIPAVQHAREKARITKCRNNVRQISVGVTHFHDSFRIVPTNGGWREGQEVLAPNGTQFTPFTIDYFTNQKYRWGAADPDSQIDSQPGSWLYSILPHIDRKNLFDRPVWKTPVSTYTCVSRRGAASTSPPERDANGEYSSGGWDWCKSDYAGNANIFFRNGDEQGKSMSLRKVIDGLSNTVLAGEKAFDLNVSRVPGTWYWDEPFMLGGSQGTVRHKPTAMRDGKGISYRGSWGSPHSGGFIATYCDNSVDMISYSVSEDVLRAQLSPSGREFF